MSGVLMRVRGIVGIALSWSLSYAAVFAVIALILKILRPQDFDPGEEPIVFVGIGLVVGFVSGANFGLIFSVAEHRKGIPDLTLIRVALWGALAAAVWPLVTPVDDRMTYILCPLGALCAVVGVALARCASKVDFA